MPEFSKVTSDSKDSEGRKIINLKKNVTIESEQTVEFSQLCMNVVNAKNALKAAKDEVKDALKSLSAEDKATWKEYIDKCD